MSNVVMTKWQCTGCGDGGEGPCTSYGAAAPHACPYGTEESMVWEAVFAPQNVEEAPKTPTNTTKGEIFSRRICDYCQGCPNAMDGNCCEFDRFNGKKLSPVC